MRLLHIWNVWDDLAPTTIYCSSGILFSVSAPPCLSLHARESKEAPEAQRPGLPWSGVPPQCLRPGVSPRVDSQSSAGSYILSLTNDTVLPGSWGPFRVSKFVTQFCCSFEVFSKTQWSGSSQESVLGLRRPPLLHVYCWAWDAPTESPGQGRERHLETLPGGISVAESDPEPLAHWNPKTVIKKKRGKHSKAVQASVAIE